MRVCWLQKPKQIKNQKKPLKQEEEKTKVVSLQANISNLPFGQKSQQHPEVGVLQRHKNIDRHTHTQPLQLYD